MAGSGSIVVPGGTGYLGGRIVEHLASQGHYVRVCTRGAPSWAGTPSARIDVNRVDWRDPDALDVAVRNAKAIIMLAAANEIAAESDPVAAADATATQCLAWLQAAQRQAVPRFVYLSTIHVYGPSDGSLISETRRPAPVHPYASTHLAAEVYVQTAHRRQATRGTIFRLSNAFGAPLDPRVNRWSLLVNDLARQALLDAALTLKSDGQQSRDFIGLSVVCRAIEWSLAAPDGGDEAAIYNLGAGESTSVYDMALTVAARAKALFGGSYPVHRRAPDTRGRPAPYNLDVSSLARAGFSHATNAEQEIDALLQFCSHHRHELLR